MAEAALFFGWGTVVRAREKAALGLFDESMQYFGRLQADGKIESFDVAVLTPSGADLAGFILIRGSAQQIDTLRRDDEFRQLVNRVSLMVEGLHITDAVVDDAIAEQIASYEKAIAQVA